MKIEFEKIENRFGSHEGLRGASVERELGLSPGPQVCAAPGKSRIFLEARSNL
jgi:hypothetical protein